MYESEVAQSCRSPSDPMDCSPPGSSVHGIFQARALEWGAIVVPPPLPICPPLLVLITRKLIWTGWGGGRQVRARSLSCHSR